MLKYEYKQTKTTKQKLIIITITIAIIFVLKHPQKDNISMWMVWYMCMLRQHTIWMNALISLYLSSDLCRQIKSIFSWSWQVLNVCFSDVLVFYSASTHPFVRKMFLLKRMWKSRCHKCKICSLLFPGNIAVEQNVVAYGIIIALFIFTYFWCTQPHFRSNPSSDFAIRHRLPK